MKFWWNTIKELRGELEDANTLLKVYKDRVNDIENSIQEQYGIKIRVEKNIINVAFDHFEMVVLSAAMDKLMKESKNSEDTIFYLKLRDKVNDLLEKWEDE